VTREPDRVTLTLEQLRALEGRARLTLTISEAAARLGVSTDVFERRVLPHVRVVPLGRRYLVLERDLARWIESQAHVLGR
jgi:excisionase family DNA binding protein